MSNARVAITIYTGSGATRPARPSRCSRRHAHHAPHRITPRNRRDASQLHDVNAAKSVWIVLENQSDVTSA